MPPRLTSNRGGPRGRGRGTTEGGVGRGGTPSGLHSIAAHVTTIGVKRPDYGSAGRQLAVRVNAFAATIPDLPIYHYDVVETDKLPARVNLKLLKVLQNEVAPTVFTPRVVYDGRKNVFAPRKLPLGDTDSAEFFVNLPVPGSTGPPNVYSIKFTLVQTINPEVLHRFIQGQMSQDNVVLTAIMALNIVIRMEPNCRFPFNSRSFFTEEGKRDIGGGIELWRGYFQSIRPAIGKMLVNVDISSAMFYKPGPLISLCLDVIGRGGGSPNLLSPASGFPDRERLRLQRFISGLRIMTETTGEKKMTIRKLTTMGANQLQFEGPEGRTTTVANYYRARYNRTLQFPGIICAEVGKGALVPLEICRVPPGQIIRKQVPSEKTKDMVEFSSKKPEERLASIREGIRILQYGQSEYIRQFGMSVETDAGPLPIQARVIQPPSLKYGRGSKQPSITPRDGAWNMIDKKFFKPARFERWIIVIYENQRRFGDQVVAEMVKGFLEACASTGIEVKEKNPLVKYENSQGHVSAQLRNAGMECNSKTGGFPNLIVVVLPDGGDAIYNKVKHFGDIATGVPTQCLLSKRCSRANKMFWANICLKVNVKLGGINVIPDPSSVAILNDPKNPTIVMGADVIHPAPGAEGRPSFTAVVGNVDSDNAKYVATSRVQTGRREIIDDLQEMCREILGMYIGYRRSEEKQPNPNPTRLIFYRDGVSEGQFKQVLDQELPLIQKACEDLKIRPKITMIIVGKRHHIRFFTQDPRQADRSGNCPAGTIVDREIAHPTEFDFYLQSHAGILGTSRPAHYSVIYDECGFNSDSLQALSFALCHVYARSTRSVSIPAPVYYADIVCSRAKNHYDPEGGLDFSDSATQVSGTEENTVLEAFKKGFKPLHKTQARLMYFS